MITSLRDLIAAQSFADGVGVYATTVPQNAQPAPAIVLKTVSSDKMLSLDGAGGMESREVDFFCLSHTPELANALADNLETLLDEYEGAMGDMTYHAGILLDRDDESIDPVDASDQPIYSARVRANIQFE